MRSTFKDLRGQRFTHIQFLNDFKKTPGGYAFLCQCKCGREIYVLGGDLRRESTTQCRDCGKRKKEVAALRRDPLYLCYQSMIGRCYRKTHTSYKWYGAKGICVCNEWLGKNGFANFRNAMGEIPEGHTLDRINSRRDYSPQNCKWSTIKEQNVNKKKSLWVVFNGKRVPLISIFQWQSSGYQRVTRNKRVYSLSTQEAFERAISHVFI